MTQHFPYSPDEVYWDWRRMGRQNSLGQTQVLLGAAPRTTVDEYMHVLTEAGLKVDVAEIESLAIARALLGPTPTDETVIVVDLGRTRSTLILVEHGIVQFSSTLRYAGRELNQFISDELHITSEQADRAKKLFGLDPKRGKGLLRRALLPHIQSIADGIADVESFYQEHYTDHRPIQRILLNGSGALLRGIDTELQTLLDHPVEVTQSWIYEQLRQRDPGLPTDVGFTYTTVFGLALQPFFPAE
jgi:type IV pilus assembly protein PilM